MTVAQGVKRNLGWYWLPIVTLALGLGSGIAVFTIVNGVLLKPLAYKDADRLVSLEQRRERDAPGDGGVSAAALLDWRKQSRSFVDLAGAKASVTDQAFNATGEGAPEHVSGIHVTASLFPLLGVAPILGRTFLPEEDQAGAEHVAVLSYELWRRRFAEDRGAIGRTIVLDGTPYTITGVMPPGFRYSPNAGAPDLWLPLVLAAHDRQHHALRVTGRLRPNVTLEQAQAEMLSVAQSLSQQFPATDRELIVGVVPLRDLVIGKSRSALLTLLGAVSFVLLIAYANIAILLLARAAEKQPELAIRLALGARRIGLIRRLITEALLLSVPGCLLGLLLAKWLIGVIVPLVPSAIPRANEIVIDSTVFLTSMLTTIGCGLVSGLPPALLSTKPNVNQILRGRSVDPSGIACRRLLITAEVALAVVLLTGSGLMMRTFVAMQRIDVGFRPENMMTLEIRVQGPRYSDPRQWRAFYESAGERMATVQGVGSVAIVAPLPLSRNAFTSSLRLESQRETSTKRALVRVVSANYFSLMGIPLLTGRTFEANEVDRHPQTAVITETTARQYWPNDNPLGHHIFLTNYDAHHWLTIVGVVGDIRDGWLTRGTPPQVYVPFAIAPMPWVSFVIRTSPGAHVLPAIREQLSLLDPNQPIESVRTMEQVLDTWFAPQRFTLILLAGFAATSLVLTVLGLYGVISYVVSRSTREIGIRMALGATRADILLWVLRGGMGLVLIGVATGAMAASYLTRLISSELYGVSPTDTPTFIGACVLFVAVGFTAILVPARRATAVHPLIALRHE